MPADGFLNIRKEKGMTSHDVVFRVRKILGTKQVGHTGTLDPNAEGVLVIAVGRATKFIQYLENVDKKYRAQLIFGTGTDTYDITGQITETIPFERDLSEVMSVFSDFQGEQMQVPPIYSALKQNGKKLYEYARKGQQVDIPARRIMIHEIKCTDHSRFPECIEIEVACSKGTYIRSLCHDIGTKLGCSSCMGDLLRLSVGDFELEDALLLDDLNAESAQEQMLSVENAFRSFPRISVKERGLHFITNGGYLYPWNSMTDYAGFEKGQIAGLYYDRQFLGLGQMIDDPETPYFKPLKML